MKKFLKILLTAVCIVIAAVIIYVAYVFTAYYRLEDNLALEVSGTGGKTIASGQQYRIVSYNVGFGAYSSDYSFFMDGGTESRARSAEAVNTNITGAVNAALELSPDLLLVQEVDTDSTRSMHINEYDMITGLLGDGKSYVFAQNYDSPYLFYPILKPHGASKAGLVTASDFNITGAIRRSLPVETGFSKILDLDRCYSKSRIEVENGKELVVYNMHLSAYTSDGTIANDQLEMLFEDMGAEYAKGCYVIAGGDFNKDLLGNSSEIFGVSGEDYTWAQPIPEDVIPDSGFRIVAPYDPNDPIPSCRNADRPYGEDNYVITVDGFIISDNVKLVYANVSDEGFEWSDHNPVYMDFILE